jgi:nitrogen regulatory protein P-II 1
MKNIEAIISPDKISPVATALAGIGIQGMTITDVKGLGREHSGICRGRPYPVEMGTSVVIELTVTDDRVDEAVAAMVDTAKKLHLTVSALDQPGAVNGRVVVYRGQPCRIKGAPKHEIEMDVEVDDKHPEHSVAAMVMTGGTLRLVFGDENDVECEKPRKGKFRGLEFLSNPSSTPSSS